MRLSDTSGHCDIRNVPKCSRATRRKPLIKDFMLCLSRYSVLARSGLCVFAILMLSGVFPCSATTPPPVPASFQDLYTSLNNYLDTFNTTLNSQWNGVKYPTLFSANLYDANADAGPGLVNSGSLATVQAQLQELKAMGVQAVTVEVSFPMLYAPFFSSQSARVRLESSAANC